MLLSLALSLRVSTAEASDINTVYFPETGHHVSEPFLSVWRQYGLPIIGYPVSERIEQNGMTVQYFERAVFEIHPEYAGTKYEVLLELLGNELAAERSDEPFTWRAGDDPAGSGDYYPETGHFLEGVFRDYWQTYGGLQVFGYPKSEPFEENGRLVQYFERNRFEWWPEHAGTRWEVLLGHLGIAAADVRGVDRNPVARITGVPDYSEDLFITLRTLNIPVLMYHRIGEPEDRYQISSWRFQQQLDWLQSNGYTTVTMSEVYDYMYAGGWLPARPVIITLDDGFASHWGAAAELDARGMRGVFFITLDQPRLADWQIRDLADRGHEIGSHTHLHGALTQYADDSLWYEVSHSKQVLEAITGRPVEFFAYPYGEYDSRVIANVAAAGYRGAVAAWGGSYWSPDLRWNEPRIEIAGTLSLSEFAYLVETFSE